MLWDSRILHQNYPSTDSKALRVIHYCNVVPLDAEKAADHTELLRKKVVVLDVLGKKGATFPHGLSETGRRLHCLAPDGEMPQADVAVADGLRQAIKLVDEAGQAEEAGNVDASVALHRRAMKAYSEIGDWYDAIMT